MAYELVDRDGKKFNINGFKRGYIRVPYEYNGLELYNENYISSNAAPFYYESWSSNRRRVRIGSSYYYPDTTNKKYVDEAYAATEITIVGSYLKSSFKDYEVYKDGNLVASGAFTNSGTDIYTCTKEANTSIIISGIWDSTNSKFIYHITTNTTITRLNSYQGDNRETTTTTVAGTGNDIIDKVYTVTNGEVGIASIKFVSQSKFKSAIATQLGISTSDIISISDYAGENIGSNGVTGNNSTSTVMGKTSDSASGENGFSKTDDRTSSSSGSYTFTITKTPSGGSTLYAWATYTIGSSDYDPFSCGTSNGFYPASSSSTAGKFSFSVTYKTDN